MALDGKHGGSDTLGGACLVLVKNGASHGYDLARQFAVDGLLGSVLTLSRPVVYRTVKSLIADGLVESTETVGVRGQLKWQLACTSKGNSAANKWLHSPVEHLRDMRTDFLVKYLLAERYDADLTGLVRRQREALEPVVNQLLANGRSDAVSMWRREQARAAMRFLDELEGGRPAPQSTPTPHIGLSARNQLDARVVSVKHGDILSSVRIELEPGQSMTSTITREAVDELRLAPGTPVVALCKATDVMIATDQSMID